VEPATDARAPYARLAVVGLICRPDALGHAERPRWLLLHRVTPFDAWDPPGGRMEADEDLIKAVKREVHEETGLEVEVGGPCYAFLTFYKGERLLAVSMACRPLGEADDVRLEGDDVAGWRWVDTAEWETMAAAGVSSWGLEDVRRATRMAISLWEAEKK
jgi:8-oxo-dGTP pyrophosphatase MutT (NUDIX family)